jgi:hypothetical protein
VGIKQGGLKTIERGERWLRIQFFSPLFGDVGKIRKILNRRTRMHAGEKEYGEVGRERERRRGKRG